jgi:hypothetical protein
MAGSLQDLSRAVEAMHGAKATHRGEFLVHEMIDGKTVWKGNVDTFALEGHARATKASAWAWDDDGEVRYIAVLNVPPINSPREAVQAAIPSGRQR